MRLLAVLLVALCPATLADVKTSEVIRAHYPAELITPPEYGEDIRFWSHEALDLNHDGRQDLVVLYANDGAGELCAILAVETAPTRICADFVSGTHGSLDLIDFDADGSPEFVVRFSSTGNGARYAWIYDWRNGWFSLGGDNQPFRDPLLFDFDGDGDLDLLDGLRFGSETQFIYTLSEGRFEKHAGEILNWLTVSQSSDPPARVVESIAVPESRRGTYPIRVVTNDSVSSARITVDGRIVFAPHDFKPGARVLVSEPVELSERSEIAVELTGKPEAKLVILVERH